MSAAICELAESQRENVISAADAERKTSTEQSTELELSLPGDEVTFRARRRWCRRAGYSFARSALHPVQSFSQF
jgi:hypothetical protein